MGISKFNFKNFKATLNGMRVCLLKRYIGPFKRRRMWLERTQWYSASELKELQLELLKRIVLHAYETVPYYNRLMQELRLYPGDIKNLDDIRKFPIMCKEDLKRAGDDIVSAKFNKMFLRTAHTGGTTGLPVPIKRDLWSIGNEHAFVRRQFDWAGVGMSNRCAYLEGRTVAAPGTNNGQMYMYDAVMKELTLSTFHLSLEKVPSYIEAMKAYGTDVLAGYPSALYVMAKGCLKCGISMPLRCALTTSEMLDDGKREVISRVFDCGVFDFYGSAERVCYIHTCEQGSYHIIPEYGLTELHPAGPPNEDCFRIVATGFWNMAMPLIRYDIGDLVQTSGEKCRCGREFPVVKRIFGRDGNLIVTPSGRILGASVIECILARVLYGMYDMPVVAGRVIQEADNLVVLEYVPADRFSGRHAKEIEDILREKVPPELKIEIRSVKQIRRTAGGKFVSFVMAEHH